MATIIRFPDVWKSAANRAVARIEPAQVIALSNCGRPSTEARVTEQTQAGLAPPIVNPLHNGSGQRNHMGSREPPELFSMGTTTSALAAIHNW
jgi:hypothetical protein